MQRISHSQIAFHPKSLSDQSGRLFSWEGKLYRAVTSQRSSLYKQLFDEGIVEHLVDKGLLIETELTPFQLDGYESVLHHRKLPFVSYPFEWCGAMLKDAALTTIDIEIEFVNYGFTLQHADPGNVLFDGPKPFYVDFGSIIPTRSEHLWPAYDEFCRFFVYPLSLMSRGHGRIARWLLHDFDKGILKTDFEALTHEQPLLGSKAKGLVADLLSKAKRCVPRTFHKGLKNSYIFTKSMLSNHSRDTKSRLKFLKQLRGDVQKIIIPTITTDWSEYYDDASPSFSDTNDWTAKHTTVYRVLSDLTPKSVLDIGSNRGWFAQLAAFYGSQVIAFDVDETCISRLYYDSKENNRSILPLIMDFRNPSPGYGLCNQWLAPASERLACDMVLALAIVHHLVFKHSLDFEQIVEGVSIFAKRWLLVEFIPHDDKYVSEWWSEEFSWYTLDNFISALRKRFHNVKILPSHPKPRVLILCEK